MPNVIYFNIFQILSYKVQAATTAATATTTTTKTNRKSSKFRNCFRTRPLAWFLMKEALRQLGLKLKLLALIKNLSDPVFDLSLQKLKDLKELV